LQAQIQDVGLALKASNTPIGATFQWLDCNNNYQEITGETNQTFTPINNGSYAVIVNNTTCTDTSACYDFVTIGEMNVSDENNFIIAPNPMTDFLYITSNLNDNITEIRILDYLGKELFIGPINQNGIDITNLKTGCYIIEILTKNTRCYRSMLKL
jgi:hypothetical protein